MHTDLRKATWFEGIAAIGLALVSAMQELAVIVSNILQITTRLKHILKDKLLNNPNKNMETEISKKLKHYRRIQNLSQEGLAEASGISIRTIQRIEKGESIGSAYTLNTLANALHINATDLVFHEIMPSATQKSDNSRQLKLLNISAFSILLIPLANIIIPTIIFLKNKDNYQVNRQGRKIISFQILWTLCTLAMMIIIPLILRLFQGVQGSSIPLSVPVYFICVALNIYFTIRFAICLNNHKSILNGIPSIL